MPCRIRIFRGKPGLQSPAYDSQFFCFMILAVLAVYRRIDPPVNGQKIAFRDLVVPSTGFHPTVNRSSQTNPALYTDAGVFRRFVHSPSRSRPRETSIAAAMKESIQSCSSYFPSPILCRQFAVIRIFPGYIIALIISICHMFQTFSVNVAPPTCTDKNWIFRYIGRFMQAIKCVYLVVVFPCSYFLFIAFIPSYCCSS